MCSGGINHVCCYLDWESSFHLDTLGGVAYPLFGTWKCAYE